MKRKDPFQLFKFRFSKLSSICNFFLSLVITYYGTKNWNRNKIKLKTRNSWKSLIKTIINCCFAGFWRRSYQHNHALEKHMLLNIMK